MLPEGFPFHQFLYSVFKDPISSKPCPSVVAAVLHHDGHHDLCASGRLLHAVRRAAGRAHAAQSP